MNKIYQISIFFTALILILIIGNFAFAGNGFFFETDTGSFEIFDNLKINGYLLLDEENDINIKGLPGDVLLENELTFDHRRTLYFCLDEKTPENIALNKNCAADKMVLVWGSDGLLAKDSTYNQIDVNRIIGQGAIILQALDPNKRISSLAPVKIVGCLQNYGSSINCDKGVTADQLRKGEIKTKDVKISELKILSQEMYFFPKPFGDNWNLDNGLVLGGQTVNFDEIHLYHDVDFTPPLAGDYELFLAENLGLQNICQKFQTTDPANTACPGVTLGGKTAAKMTQPNFDNNASYTCNDAGEAGPCVKSQFLCCYLNISF